MTAMPSALTLIVKVTTACNLACKYCYVDKPSDVKNSGMPLETIECLISKTQDVCEQVNYVWHGGEPLLLGPSYFDYIAVLQQLYRKSESQIISNSIQTGGVLLSQQFADSLLNNKFSIGISYDANAPDVAPSRPFATGRPSEALVRNRIQILKSASGSAGVLSVITRDNCEDAPGMLDRLSSLGINGVSFLPFKLTPNSPDLAVDPDRWADFLIEVFECWLNNSCSIKHIEPLESMILGLVGAAPSLCTYAGPCFTRYLSIYPNGEVYPCSSLIGPEFLLGNIRHNSLEQIFTSPSLTASREAWRAAVNKHCASCLYILACRGACPEYAYFAENRLRVSDSECKARKRVFAHIAQRLQELAPPSFLQHVSHPCLNGIPDTTTNA